MLNAAPPRAGILIPEAKGLFKPETANLTPFFWTVTPPVFFLGKENGGCALAARRRHKGAQCAKNSRFPVRGRKENTMHEYFYVKIKPTAGFFSLTLDPEYRNIIDHAAEEGWRYVGYLPASQSADGCTNELDLIFEREKA
jgi:hypothetical protein